jgi:hypothetical protein
MIDMIDIVMAKIETTKPPVVCQPVGPHVQGIPAACPTTGLNTEMPMTMMMMMMKFANPNDNVNVSETMMTPNAATAHVSRRVQRSWENLVPKAAPARLPKENVTTVVASRTNVATRETICQLFATKKEQCKRSFRLLMAVAYH